MTRGWVLLVGELLTWAVGWGLVVLGVASLAILLTGWLQ